jgi:hypothetical protein
MEIMSFKLGDIYMVSTTGGLMPVWKSVFPKQNLLQIGTVGDGDIVLYLGESHGFSKKSIYVKVLAAGMVGWLAGYLLDKI